MQAIQKCLGNAAYSPLEECLVQTIVPADGSKPWRCLTVCLPHAEMKALALRRWSVNGRKQERMLHRWTEWAAEERQWKQRLDNVLASEGAEPSKSRKGKANGRKSPGRSPSGSSPNGRSSNGRSPSGSSPNGRSPNGRSPNGRSPNARKPTGPASVSGAGWDATHATWKKDEPPTVFKMASEVIERLPEQPATGAPAAGAAANPTPAAPTTTPAAGHAQASEDPPGPSATLRISCGFLEDPPGPSATAEAATRAADSATATAGASLYAVSGRPLLRSELPEGAVAVPIQVGVPIGAAGDGWRDAATYYAISEEGSTDGGGSAAPPYIFSNQRPVGQAKGTAEAWGDLPQAQGMLVDLSVHMKQGNVRERLLANVKAATAKVPRGLIQRWLRVWRLTARDTRVSKAKIEYVLSHMRTLTGDMRLMRYGMDGFSSHSPAWIAPPAPADGEEGVMLDDDAFWARSMRHRHREAVHGTPLLKADSVRVQTPLCMRAENARLHTRTRAHTGRSTHDMHVHIHIGGGVHITCICSPRSFSLSLFPSRLRLRASVAVAVAHLSLSLLSLLPLCSLLSSLSLCSLHS